MKMKISIDLSKKTLTSKSCYHVAFLGRYSVSSRIVNQDDILSKITMAFFSFMTNIAKRSPLIKLESQRNLRLVDECSLFEHKSI